MPGFSLATGCLPSLVASSLSPLCPAPVRYNSVVHCGTPQRGQSRHEIMQHKEISHMLQAPSRSKAPNSGCEGGVAVLATLEAICTCHCNEDTSLGEEKSAITPDRLGDSTPFSKNSSTFTC